MKKKKQNYTENEYNINNFLASTDSKNFNKRNLQISECKSYRQ